MLRAWHVTLLVTLTHKYADYITSYYQACKGASPLRAGVLCLPVTLVLVPSLVCTGLSIRKTQVYRPQLIVGWCIVVLAMGTLSSVHGDSPLGRPLGFSALVTLGAGMMYQGTYFPVLAPLSVKDNAYALSFFAYCRQFAAVRLLAAIFAMTSRIPHGRSGVLPSEAPFCRMS